MKWIKRVGIVLGVVLVALIALPFFISLNDYIPQIEKEVSAKLNEPVSIKSIRLVVLPLPHLKIDGITVGKAEDIKLGKVLVTPELLSLLGSPKIIRSIEIESLNVAEHGIGKIFAWSKPDPRRPDQPAAFRVESIRLDNATVTLDKTSLGPFDARVRLDSKGAAQDASITTQDGKLKAVIKPDEKSNYQIEATAKAWKPPFGPAVLFDELAVKGIATANAADFSHVSAKLYGGTVNGKATLGWEKGVRLKGALDVNQIELKSLVPLFSPGTPVTGRLSAKPVFSASAADAGLLTNALRVETPFSVHNGVLHGVDIQSAATNLFKQGQKGGETRFDQLTGHLVMERGAYRFTGLKVASGVLAADGNVNISPRKELAGRVTAHVKALGTSAAVPLNVSGTVDSPLLLPTGASIAGAAVGTAILGPGVGTTVGAKVGGWAEGLFGKKDGKTR